jgi:3-oxocholest-4-en-26-oate---CoA ligase
MTTPSPTRDWNFASAYESVADAIPDRIAMIQGSRTVTWADLDDRAARLAGALRAAGLEPGAKVASYLYNSNEYLEGVLATFKLRCVPVNVNYRYLEDELLYLLDNSDAEALLFHGSLAEPVAAVLAKADKLKIAIQVDDGSPHLEGTARYEDLIASTPPMERIDRSGDDMYFLYTGGTTGMPKGVMWRSEDLFGVLGESIYPMNGVTMPERSADAGERAAQILEQSRVSVHLPASPLMHGTGMFTTFQAMMMGGTIVTLESRSFDAHELWRAVQDHSVSMMAIVGDAFAKPMLRALREAEEKGEPYDTSSLGLVISSGVMWSSEVKAEMVARAGCFCLDTLGSSEGVGFGDSMTGPGQEPSTAKFRIGAKTKVFLDDGREAAPGSGEIGMLALGGYIPVGYYKDETKSGSTFRMINGARYSVPGDMATVEADGTITLLGRGSAVINSGGEKIFPEEVEEAIKGHPDVLDCLVVGLPDERFGQAVTAVVSVADGAQLTGEALTDQLAVLARYKHPRRFVFGAETYRAPNGKADYKAARAAAEVGGD